MEVRQLLNRGRVRISILVGSVAAIAALAAPPAGANHIPGATYTGTVSGGGTVELRVSPDGASVTYFKYTGVPGFGFPPRSCGAETTATFSAAITNHAFNFGQPGLRAFGGSFSTSRTVTGTVEEAFCFNGAKNWTATTTAVPPPPPPPQPPPPARSANPHFQNDQTLRLLRGAKRVVRVRLRFRGCGGTPPYRLVVSQRRRVGNKVVAQGSVRVPVRGGLATSSAACRDYIVLWRLGTKFFGAGRITFILKLVDATGAESRTPHKSVRAPKP